MKHTPVLSAPILSRAFTAALSLAVLAACTVATPLQPTDMLKDTETPVPPSLTDTPVLPTAAALLPSDTPVPSALLAVTSPQIISLHMVDANNGWGITETNIVLTTDGGMTWLDATPSGLASVGYSPAAYYADASQAWVVIPAADYVTGTLCRTMDGGQSWSSFPVPFPGGSMQFLDTLNGWILVPLGAGAGSEAVVIFQTMDGGETWTQLFINDPTAARASDTLPLSGMKSGITFLDAEHAWVGGSIPMDGFVYLYTTSDGGITWSQQSITLPSGFETAQTVVDQPIFFSPMDGIFHMRLYAAEISTVFYVTHDGGNTWTSTFPINLGGSYAIASLADAWIWDGSTTMYITHDSGVIWDSLTTNIDVHDTLMGFQFVDSLIGWAQTVDASGHYALYNTVDGGANWTPIIP